MLEIKKLESNLYHIVHEPGDMTRYDYFIYQSGDDFKFMSKNNVFAYPIQVNIRDTSNIESPEDCKMYILGRTDISNDVNPYTLLQCIMVMRVIDNNEITT